MQDDMQIGSLKYTNVIKIEGIMKHDYCIKSERITISAMTKAESEKYRRLRNRKDNIVFFFSQKEITADEQKAWYEIYLLDDSQIMFSIYENSSNAFIGGVGLYDINKKTGRAEVGRIIIDREIAAGKRYGAEAIKLVQIYTHQTWQV